MTFEKLNIIESSLIVVLGAFILYMLFILLGFLLSKKNQIVQDSLKNKK